MVQLLRDSFNILSSLTIGCWYKYTISADSDGVPIYLGKNFKPGDENNQLEESLFDSDWAGPTFRPAVFHDGRQTQSIPLTLRGLVASDFYPSEIGALFGTSSV